MCHQTFSLSASHGGERLPLRPLDQAFKPGRWPAVATGVVQLGQLHPALMAVKRACWATDPQPRPPEGEGVRGWRVKGRGRYCMWPRPFELLTRLGIFINRLVRRRCPAGGEAHRQSSRTTRLPRLQPLSPGLCRPPGRRA